MDCDRCGRPAVHHAAYSGSHLCETHLCRSVEKRVRRRIRSDGLIGRDATPDEPETWLIGLSGGKDSVVLTHILHETFAEDPRIRLVCLTIHEGIEGYRDASLDASVELVEKLGIEHELLSYAEEFDLEMDDVAREDPEGMAPCAYCGVFRRNLLEAGARTYDADKLLTGHNLDDETQTALMNLFEGDVRQVAKHFDASLGGFDEREASRASDDASGQSPRARGESDHFVPRAKPLRDVPEKEVALYAHLRDLPVHMAECPHASEAYRGEIKDLLLGLEANHPGTRHSIIAGYEELAALAAREYRGDGSDGGDGDTDEGGPSLRECERCGATTTQDVCRKCQLTESVHAAD